MPITLKQLQECEHSALNNRCVWHGASLSDPHFILDHMIMSHLSLTLDAAVIPNSSLPGQRKHWLLSAKCCNCVLIHKDRVSRWTQCEPPLPTFPRWPRSCTTEDFLAIVTPAAIMGLLADYAGVGGGERDLPRCFWKDVWNRSMGIKRLGSVGGLLCGRLSPLLASMISSIDIEALLCSLFLFH